MKHLRTLGICALALCALSLAVVSSASATAPEYGRCLKAEKNVKKEWTGSFSDSKCNKKVTEAEKAKKGKYNWFPGAVKKLQTSVGGKGVLEEVGKNLVICASESSVGEYVGTKEAKNLIVKFKGCEAGPQRCTSPGHEIGELETNVLEGRAVWENEAAHKTALDLFPALGQEQFIEFNCGGATTVAVKGSILVPIKADKMATTFVLKYKAKHGFQQLEQYEEGGKKITDVLLSNFAGKGFAQAGQTITSTVTNEEALELNSYV